MPNDPIIHVRDASNTNMENDNKPPSTGNDAVIKYDPNLTRCGAVAKQLVRLTFALWQYRATAVIVVRGNCNGLSVIECAVSIAFDSLEFTEYEGAEYARILLKDAEGNTLESEDDEGEGEDWLKNMLIAAEIVEIVPDQKSFSTKTVTGS